MVNLTDYSDSVGPDECTARKGILRLFVFALSLAPGLSTIGRAQVATGAGSASQVFPNGEFPAAVGIEIPFVAVPQSSVEVDATVKPALADYAPSGTAPREAQDAPGAAPFATVGKHRRPVWSSAVDECRLLHPGCRAPAFRRLCAVRLRCARIPGSPRCRRVHPDHAAGVDHSRGPRSIRHSRPRAELVPDSRVEHLNATVRLRAGHGAFSTRSAVATTL